MYKVIYTIFIALSIISSSYAFANANTDKFVKDENDTQVFYEIFSNTSAEKKLEDRIAIASEELLDIPYGQSNSGSFEKLVCTTFIDNVLAISYLNKHSDFEDYKSMLRKIQYSSTKKDFTHMNHFFSLDWIPNLLKKGMAEDITIDIHETFVPHNYPNYAKTKINKLNWYKVNFPSKVKSFKKNFPRYKAQTAKLPYISLKDIFKYNTRALKSTTQYHDIIEISKFVDYIEDYIVKNDEEFRDLKDEISETLELYFKKHTIVNLDLLHSIPNGTIVSVVRPNWNMKKTIGTNLNISHVGFAIWKNNKLYFRHASTNHKAVVDEDFVEYFRKYILSPTIKGINFVLPLKKK